MDLIKWMKLIFHLLWIHMDTNEHQKESIRSRITVNWRGHAWQRETAIKQREFSQDINQRCYTSEHSHRGPLKTHTHVLHRGHLHSTITVHVPLYEKTILVLWKTSNFSLDEIFPPNIKSNTLQTPHWFLEFERRPCVSSVSLWGAAALDQLPTVIYTTKRIIVWPKTKATETLL